MKIKQHITKYWRGCWINKKGNEKKKIPKNKWQWKHDDPKPMEFSESNSKREVYSNTTLLQEISKASNRQLSSTSKAAGKRRTKYLKVSRRKDIIKIRAEIIEKEMKEAIARIIKLKPGSLRR